MWKTHRLSLLVLVVTLSVILGAAAPQSTRSSPETTPPVEESARPVFRDLAREAGITFVHQSAPEAKYITESMSGGVALLDFDADGLLDIYFTNALTMATAERPKSAPSALYRNQGDGTFVDVAKEAGVAYPGWAMGACVADVDGNGYQDLYVTALGRNHLYLNQGDGTFVDAAEEREVTGGGWSTGCGFADYDRDGRLDLFVSRYVEIDFENLPEFGKGKHCQYRGIAVQCGPRGLPGTSDLLFRQGSDGRFSEVAEAAGVADPEKYFGLGIAWFDYRQDGWPDLFVANDASPNLLYRNRGDGTFAEEAFPMGVAVSEDGAEQGCMGVAVGDYRNEGRFSLFVTNFSEEYNVLYHHQGGYFTDESFRSGTAPKSLSFVGWGTAFFDYDNDGWLDLIVVNGHVYPQLQSAKLGASAPYRQPAMLYRNRGDGSFEDVTAQQGPTLTEERVGRGLVVGDLDSDGRLDVVVNGLEGSPQVLHNDLADAGSWLLVKLEGEGQNTDTIGAVITVRAGKLTQTRNIRSGTGYLSQDDMRQHFGLGAARQADSVEVLWPDGTTSRLEKVDADQVVVIRQSSKGQ